MSPGWNIGAKSEEERSRRKDIIDNSRAVLDLLATVAQEQIVALSTSPFGDYSDAGWPYREADRKGQIRALKNILVLCNHPEGKT